MIEAMIFDLDGTLMQTEKLKALSYARAAVELCPTMVTEDEVIAAFRGVVGRSRQEVATILMEQFGLTEIVNARRAEFGVSTAWEAYVQVRLKYYEAMLADPNVLIDNQWPHNVALLKMARIFHSKIGLATMSYSQQSRRVLSVLGLTDQFDFIASRDDVEHGKPNPEIYLMVAKEFAIEPENILVIEDSPSGVAAAINAGMHVIAVTTPFTREHIHEGGLLDEKWIVDDPDTLLDVVRLKYQEAR